MVLTVDDMTYLDNKFSKLCDDISNLDNKVDAAKLATAERLTKIEVEFGQHVKQKVDESTKRYRMFNKLTTIGLGILGSITGVNLLS